MPEPVFGTACVEDRVTRAGRDRGGLTSAETGRLRWRRGAPARCENEFRNSCSLSARAKRINGKFTPATVLVVPPFRRLAEALGVLAVSSRNLNWRRGSSAAPFLLAGTLRKYARSRSDAACPADVLLSVERRCDQFARVQVCDLHRTLSTQPLRSAVFAPVSVKVPL
jgi:hypothetical protein